MSLLLDYVKRYKKILFGALALTVINQVFSLLDPQIFRLIIDNYATRALELTRSEFLRGVILLLFGAIGVAFISRVAKNFQDYYVNVIGLKVSTELYGDGVKHSFSLPYAVFEDQRSGELLEKLQKARTDAAALIQSAINILFFSLVGIVFVLAYAFTVHWTIGITYFLMIPTLGFITFLISQRLKKVQQQIFAETAELSGSTTETLRNVELVKSVGLENQETKRLNDLNERILGLQLKKTKLNRKLSFIQGTLINALRSLILLLMLWLIWSKIITLGEFFSILFYSFFIFNPLAELGTVANQYQETRASNDAFRQILAMKPEAKPKDAIALGPLESIKFEKVKFAYEKNPVLQNISLEVKSGETVAFVGPSGSGKTTLIKLIVGLYRPTAGALRLNDSDGSKVDYENLRRRIGYVAQETQLFAGTVRENLLFIRPSATNAECMEALRQAEALGITERGGKGLDTKIGEGGIKISGGERQRLAIARALLRNPELIIFDEATSSLDSITEKAITSTIQKIEKARPNLMTVLIAHRLSTIAHAKRIYVLEKGKIVEEGNHAKLLSKKGLYAALWREQVGERSN